MRTKFKHIYCLSKKVLAHCRNHSIHTLVIFSLAFGGTPVHAGSSCVADCTEYPCFRPTTLKDDNTPFAFELCSIYEIARCHDPTLQAAKQAQLAVQESMPQAQASFLPVITAQAEHLNAFDTGGSLFSQEGIVISKVGSYVSNVYTLALTQPILHFEHWNKFEQACDLVKAANATFAFAEQDLMIRTAKAYFGVLEAIDGLYFATAQLNALKKFYEQTNERFKVGLIAITDVQIAKARHDSAVAQVINAKTAISNQLEKLREIVGYRVEHLLPLKDDLNLPSPEPSDPEQWVAVALKQNFQLQSQRYQTLAAREDIKITETGHLPTIDLNGQVQRITPNNQIQFKGTTSQLSVQVNLPLFSGGSVISKTRQARHTFLQHDKETETLFRTIESNTRQFFLNVLTQISQVAAYKQAVISNRAALEATQASFNVGTRTIVDVLNAQTDLIQAQFNLATARYGYILQSFELKRSAGILSPMDLCAINCWLKPTAADAIIKKGDVASAISINEKNLQDELRERSTGVTVEESNSIGANISNSVANKLGNNQDSNTTLNQAIGNLNPEDSGKMNDIHAPGSTTPTAPITPAVPTTNGAPSTPVAPTTNQAPTINPTNTPSKSNAEPNSPKITYPGSSTTPLSDPFNALPDTTNTKVPHAPPPPPSQTNPSTAPSTTLPSAPSAPSTSPGAKNDKHLNKPANVNEHQVLNEEFFNLLKEGTENKDLLSKSARAGKLSELQLKAFAPENVPKSKLNVSTEVKVQELKNMPKPKEIKATEEKQAKNETTAPEIIAPMSY